MANNFEWKLPATPTRRWAAPPEWPPLPAGFNDQNDWDPSDPAYPVPEGWDFWRRLNGAPASAEDWVVDQYAEFVASLCANRLASHAVDQARSCSVEDIMLRQATDLVRELERDERVLKDHPAVGLAYRMVLARERKRAMLQQRKIDQFIFACCMWDDLLPQWEIERRGSVTDLEERLDEGFRPDDVPKDLQTPQGRRERQGWLLAVAIWLRIAFAEAEGRFDPQYAEVEVEHDRQLDWARALSTGTLPFPRGDR